MNMFDQVINCIIRPHRDIYKMSKLGPRDFTVFSKISTDKTASLVHNNSSLGFNSAEATRSNQNLHSLHANFDLTKNKSAIAQTNSNNLAPAEAAVEALPLELEVERQDHIVMNKRNKKIHMSHFVIQNLKQKQLSTLIYVHANNGSRAEGLAYTGLLLEHEINVVLFDCTGSGLSDGDYITLGMLESEDLECVVDFLEQNTDGGLGKLLLWGRSMGAVTCKQIIKLITHFLFSLILFNILSSIGLLYASKNLHPLTACVYDSPFCSLQLLIEQLATSKTGLPSFIFSPLVSIVDKHIKEKAGVSISDIKIKDKTHLIKAPGMLITSKKDRLVGHEHSETIYAQYTAPKVLEYIDNEHHEFRPKSIITKILGFLLHYINKDVSTTKHRHRNSNGAASSLTGVKIFSNNRDKLVEKGIKQAVSKNGAKQQARVQKTVTQASEIDWANKATNDVLPARTNSYNFNAFPLKPQSTRPVNQPNSIQTFNTQPSKSQYVWEDNKTQKSLKRNKQSRATQLPRFETTNTNGIGIKSFAATSTPPSAHPSKSRIPTEEKEQLGQNTVKSKKERSSSKKISVAELKLNSNNNANNNNSNQPKPVLVLDPQIEKFSAKFLQENRRYRKHSGEDYHVSAVASTFGDQIGVGKVHTALEQNKNKNQENYKKHIHFGSTKPESAASHPRKYTADAMAFRDQPLINPVLSKVPHSLKQYEAVPINHYMHNPSHYLYHQPRHHEKNADSFGSISNTSQTGSNHTITSVQTPQSQPYSTPKPGEGSTSKMSKILSFKKNFIDRMSDNPNVLAQNEYQLKGIQQDCCLINNTSYMTSVSTNNFRRG